MYLQAKPPILCHFFALYRSHTAPSPFSTHRGHLEKSKHYKCKYTHGWFG